MSNTLTYSYKMPKVTGNSRVQTYTLTGNSKVQNYTLASKAVIAIRNHKVWPIKSTPNSLHYCSCARIDVQDRPWAHFETFSESAQLFIYPLPARFQDEDILRAISKQIGDDDDAEPADALGYLAAHIHKENVLRLEARFTELMKGNRRYKSSRYYVQHMQDTVYSFVTQDHINNLVLASDRQLRANETHVRKLRDELGIILRQEKPLEVTGKPDGMTKVARAEIMALRGIKNELGPKVIKAPPKPSSIPENAPANAAMVFGDDEGDELSEAEYMAMVREDMRRVNDQEKFNK